MKNEFKDSAEVGLRWTLLVHACSSSTDEYINYHHVHNEEVTAQSWNVKPTPIKCIHIQYQKKKYSYTTFRNKEW